MPSVTFTHPECGTLTISDGIVSADWSYQLNTANYPTYGGEVVQILSVSIGDLTLNGLITTYDQIMEITSYFTHYLIIATQGSTSTPSSETSYNLQPMTFVYGERGWTFYIYPKSIDGFSYETGAVGRPWQITAHVIDNSPDLSLITEGIKGMIVPSSGIGGVIGTDVSLQGTFSITGNLSPNSGDPNQNSFQTYNAGAQSAVQQITAYADYYNNLIPSYMQGNFTNLVGTVGSQPNFGTTNSKKSKQATVKVKSVPKK